jgi:hypothetical protein
MLKKNDKEKPLRGVHALFQIQDSPYKPLIWRLWNEKEFASRNALILLCQRKYRKQCNANPLL